MKYNKKINLSEFLLLFLVFTSIVFLLLAGTGTLFSGFHYVDDHEFAETEFLLKKEQWSIVRTIRSWIVFDRGKRFRPLYYTLRVLTVAIFGVNTVAISILRGFIASMSMTILYCIGRMTGSNRFFSFLFPPCLHHWISDGRRLENGSAGKSGNFASCLHICVLIAVS